MMAAPMSARGPDALPSASSGADPTSAPPISARMAAAAAVTWRRALSWASCTLLATHRGGTHDASPPVISGRAKNQKLADFRLAGGDAAGTVGKTSGGRYAGGTGCDGGPSAPWVKDA